MFPRSPRPRLFLVPLLLALAPLTARAQAPAYQVDTNSSRVYAKVGKASRIGHEHGIQGNFAGGKITLGGAGELVFDMRSFVADTPQARQYVGLPADFSQSDAAKVNANMRGGEVLDVANHPRATFAITSITPADGQKAGEPGRYQLDGKFTLHGNTQPLRFTATVQQTNRPGVLHARGSFSIFQSSFGITPYSALGGLVKVADQMEIYGDLTLVPAR